MRRDHRQPRPAFAVTPQMVFRPACSSPKTPEAVKKRTAMLSSVARVPEPVSAVCWIVRSTASASWGPTARLISAAMRPSAACRPKTAPAMATAITKSGDSEKTV